MERRDYIVLTAISLAAIVTGTSATEQPLDQFLVSKTIEAAHFAFIMAWETWWALVLGFAIAGGVQAWLSREVIADALRHSGPRELGLATFFGFISSSCSYSAVATAKNLFRKGASAGASLAAFMFASTNLVIEIGVVIFLLLGWQFVAADIVGGIILILLMAVVLEQMVPEGIIEQARQQAGSGDSTVRDPVCGMEIQKDGAVTAEIDGRTYHFCSTSCRDSFDPDDHPEGIMESITSIKGWKRLADEQWSEWSMLWEDILVGFILAGIIAAFVPESVWLSLFSGQHLGLGALAWSAVLGTVIGVVTFVCSVGNVPFAAVLWGNGLPFGAVLSYIYADLIVPPIMDAYRKYYGAQFAIILSGAIFVAAVVTGVIVHLLFATAGMIPPQSSANIIERGIRLNYKAVLNTFFTAAFLGLWWLHRR
ncbi:MAG: permease [Candidatus Nanohaloarchaea archaeon]|nr:permease [Candidatus Nanohaloarchaea archaeon]